LCAVWPTNAGPSVPEWTSSGQGSQPRERQPGTGKRCVGLLDRQTASSCSGAAGARPNADRRRARATARRRESESPVVALEGTRRGIATAPSARAPRWRASGSLNAGARPRTRRTLNGRAASYGVVERQRNRPTAARRRRTTRLTDTDAAKAIISKRRKVAATAPPQSRTQPPSASPSDEQSPPSAQRNRHDHHAQASR
jgi:hypothetical protein